MAYGFKPVRCLYGGVPTPNKFRSYSIATGYGTGIFTGDPVKLTTDGTLVLATVGVVVVGVFGGVRYKNASGEIIYSRYWPASTTATEIEAMVYDDPWTIFKVSADQDTTPLAAAQVGENVDLISGSGSTLTGISGYSVDSSTQGAGSDIGFKILQTAQEANETQWTAAGTAMDVFVLPNEHFYKAPTVGL